ncbi:GNAT family N-acetyltransferase [uncultured Metabacillus sp.]|uniref:GNAT family N-acetyltransferase n=1 Tax=Metabacillus sp. Hm71 TaxID=3450743 RepID=UPI002621A326|nr:GNAT family N-acetyltransferase [uncultured Metabacillus sp.]
MIEILTNRLMIIPCSLDIAKSLVFHRKELDKRSPIEFPYSWPSSFVKGFLPFYIECLENKQPEKECGLWLIILYEEKKIIGDILLLGKPSKEGDVELCYHVEDKDVDESLAFEAVDAFIDWLTYQKFVKRIVMECDVRQDQSIRLFEKLGMICTKKDGRFLKWEIQKKDLE